jgi:biotin transport system substrate-specific component
MQTTLGPTLTRRFWPQAALWMDILLIVIGSIFVALFAQISIPLPFTPVPITGQTFAVLLVGAVLGSRRGAATLALYVAEGCFGLPVFAGGTAGLAKLLGPTGGYLVGFIVAAFVVGYLAERGMDRKWTTTLIPFLIGTVIIYAIGVPWLAVFIGWNKALAGGLWPFLIGDAIKLVLAALVMPSAWMLVKSLERGGKA